MHAVEQTVRDMPPTTSRAIHRCARLAVSVGLVAIALPGVARNAAAQAAAKAVAQPAAAQAPATGAREGITLRLHPRVGDTLYTRLEQLTEVTNQLRPTTGPPSRATTTSVTVSARTIVQASRASTTTVLTVVDSANVQTSDPRGTWMAEQAKNALMGQQFVLKLAEDGSVESAHDARGMKLPRDVAEAMAAMPAVFPHRAVMVGDRWKREMPLPAGGPLGGRGAAHVMAEFRLDSLGRGGELAYLSMRGDIVPEGASVGKLTGTVSGAMQVDRLRGWMTDSRFSLMIRSTVTPPAASNMAPMHFVTRVTQRLRTMDKR